MKSFFLKNLVFLMLISLAACQSSSPENTQNVKEPDPAEKPVESAKADQNTESEFPFPVFEKFEDFKPFLEPEDDKLYVINFWATWCKPCIEELPYFEQVNEEYAKDQVKVMLVSLDAGKQIPRRLVPFMDKHDLKSEVLVLDDPNFNAWIDQVSPKWSGAIPATIFIKGKTQDFFEQSYTLEELKKQIDTYL